MKISIIVPIYNAEDFLEECIKSVLQQTSDNWELILVNDGSTDKSAEICELYHKEYPDKIFVFHKKNEGQFLTRKFGILKCAGDYIGFLDADDIIEKNYIKTLTEAIREFNAPDVICFGFIRFANDLLNETKVSEQTTLFETLQDRAFVYKQIVSGNITGSLWSKLFKANIICDNIPDKEKVENKRFAEDAYHAFDAMAKSKSILYLNQSLYRYRNNPNGFSNGFENRALDYFSSKYLYDLIENNLSVMGIDDVETKSCLCRRNINETVYFMLKYFRAAKTLKRKKEIIDYDWSSYLLDSTIEQIENGAEFRKSYMKVWNAFKKKKYVEILFREKFKKIIGW